MHGGFASIPCKGAEPTPAKGAKVPLEGRVSMRGIAGQD